jgi:hypothetical protein
VAAVADDPSAPSLFFLRADDGDDTPLLHLRHGSPYYYYYYYYSLEI